MKYIKYAVTAFLATALAVASSAQSRSFKLGQWTEIYNSVVKELNRSYVD